MLKETIVSNQCRQNKEIAHKFLTAITEGDLDTIGQLLHPELRM